VTQRNTVTAPSATIVGSAMGQGLGHPVNKSIAPTVIRWTQIHDPTDAAHFTVPRSSAKLSGLNPALGRFWSVLPLVKVTRQFVTQHGM